MSLSSESTLAPLVQALEATLAQAQQALTQRDALLLEEQASRVQSLMAQALQLARGAPLEAVLRQRLARCGAQMAAQRQALFRASTALDRAMEVLMPAEPTGLYGETGRALRQRSRGGSMTA